MRRGNQVEGKPSTPGLAEGSGGDWEGSRLAVLTMWVAGGEAQHDGWPQALLLPGQLLWQESTLPPHF